MDTEYIPPTMDNGQSTLGSNNNFSINSVNEEAATFEMVKQIPMDYNYNNQRIMNKLSYASSVKSTPSRLGGGRKVTSATSNMRYETGTNKTAGSSSRKQLVYIGGIDEMNRLDVRDRLFDLFEMWGDKPDISEADGVWDNDCIYVRFPSIAKAIDGINVFDGIQPNGYVLSAELVLEGSQMVYIDGLDGDWNEEVFKNFMDISNNMHYRVSVKKINDKKGGDKAYAFVQFQSLEAVQSAIDRFDGETEIDGKLVRWEHMVKAYIGKIGENVTPKDIQRELSEFDPSFKNLPVEIRKSREPMYYPRERYETDITSDDTKKDVLKDRTKRKLKKKRKKMQKPMEKFQILNKGNNDSLGDKSATGNTVDVKTPPVGTGSVIMESSTIASSLVIFVYMFL